MDNEDTNGKDISQENEDEDSEIEGLFAFKPVTNHNILDGLTDSYKNKPTLSIIEFPHKY